MKEEKVEVIKKLLEPKSTRNIEVFLGFANLYKIFIRNFNKIVALLISMLQTISANHLSILPYRNRSNYETPSCTGNSIGNGKSARTENLSNIANLTKSKNPDMTKSKKAKNWEFVTVNFFKTDFRSPELKKIFIYL